MVSTTRRAAAVLALAVLLFWVAPTAAHRVKRGALVSTTSRDFYSKPVRGIHGSCNVETGAECGPHSVCTPAGCVREDAFFSALRMDSFWGGMLRGSLWGIFVVGTGVVVFRFGVAGPHRNEPWFVFTTIFTIGAFIFMLVSGLLFGSLVVEAEFGDDPALDVDDVATAVGDGGNFTMCQHIHDPICYPYLCYPPTRVCLTSCVRDAFCADWGHECRDGDCVPIEKESGDEGNGTETGETGEDTEVVSADGQVPDIGRELRWVEVVDGADGASAVQVSPEDALADDSMKDKGEGEGEGDVDGEERKAQSWFGWVFWGLCGLLWRRSVAAFWSLPWIVFVGVYMTTRTIPRVPRMVIVSVPTVVTAAIMTAPVQWMTLVYVVVGVVRMSVAVGAHLQLSSLREARPRMERRTMAVIFGVVAVFESTMSWFYADSIWRMWEPAWTIGYPPVVGRGVDFVAYMAGDVPILSWQMFFIAVPALACALFAFFYAYIFLPTASGSLKRSRAGFQLGLFLFAVLVLCVVGTFFPHNSQLKLFGVDGDGEACDTFYDCLPYTCDFNTSACRQTCTRSSDCVQPFLCEDGTCVAKPDSSFRRKVVTMIENLIIVGGVCLALGCCWSHREAAPIAFWLFVAVYVLLLVTGVRLNVVVETNRLLENSRVGNGSACAEADAVICGSFACNMRNMQCETECTSSWHCAEGYICQSGDCVADPHRLTYSIARWSWLGMLGRILAVVAAIFIIASVGFWYSSGERLLLLRILFGPQYGISSKEKSASAFVVIAVTFIAFAMFVGSFFLHTTFEPTPSPEGWRGEVCETWNDGACAPYYCNETSQRCFGVCGHDYDCRPGHECGDDGRCHITVENPYLLTRYFFVYLYIGALFAVCTIKYFVVRQPPMTWTMKGLLVFMAAVTIWVLLALARVLFYSKHMIETTGNGAECSVLASSACYPYLCDTTHGQCMTTCAADAECGRLNYCTEQGECVPLTPDRLMNTTKLVTGAVALVQGIATALPYVQRVRQRWAQERARRARERVLKEIADREAMLARVRQEHSTPLSVDVPNPLARDYTVPTPRNTVTTPGGSQVNDVFLFPSVFNGNDVPDDLFANTDSLCSICFSVPSVARMVGRNCRHGFCPDCAEQSMQSIFDNAQFPARCPGCAAASPYAEGEELAASLIPAEVIERLVGRGVLDIDFGRRFVIQQVLHAFERGEVMRCPVCDLLNVVPDHLDDKAASTMVDPFKVECNECEMTFCAKCNRLYHGHGGLDCEAFSRKMATQDDALSESYVAETSKPCPNCTQPITHWRGHACHHIAPGTGCPSCGHHFCIVCLEPNPCSRNGHSLFCDDTCDCLPCPDCTPGHPCPTCDGGTRCPSCHPP